MRQVISISLIPTVKNIFRKRRDILNPKAMCRTVTKLSARQCPMLHLIRLRLHLPRISIKYTSLYGNASLLHLWKTAFRKRLRLKLPQVIIFSLLRDIRLSLTALQPFMRSQRMRARMMHLHRFRSLQRVICFALNLFWEISILHSRLQDIRKRVLQKHLKKTVWADRLPMLQLHQQLYQGNMLKERASSLFRQSLAKPLQIFLKIKCRISLT